MMWNISIGKISVLHYRNIGEFPYIGALILLVSVRINRALSSTPAPIIVLYNNQNLPVYGLSLQTGVVK